MKPQGKTRSIFPRVEEFVRRRRLLPEGSSVLLAVSGGQDSVGMLTILRELAPKLKLRLSVAHVNHLLRGAESDSDETFVSELAASAGLPFFVERVDPAALSAREKRSVEDAARELRYEALERMRVQARSDLIATAHTADDNAETVLFNLARGSGVRGLAGIPVKRGNIVRPLRCLGREEVARFLAERGVQHRDDSSNLSLNATRNFIRLEIIPRIRDGVNDECVRNIDRASRMLAELGDFLEAYTACETEHVSRVEGGDLFLDISGLKRYLIFIRREIIRSAVRSWSRKSLAFEQVEEILGIADSDNGTSLALPGRLKVWKEKSSLVFTSSSRAPFSRQIEIGHLYEFPEFSFSSEICRRNEVRFIPDPSVEFVDEEKLAPPLVLRSWSSQDSFQPLGLGSMKRVGAFLADKGVPRRERDSVLVLESDGKIVWLCGHRLDARYSLSEQATRVAKLVWRRR